MVLKCYQGWGGEELEKPAFEALAAKPEIYGLDKSPIVPFSMIDWSAVVDYYKDNAKPNFNMRGTIPLLEDDNPKGKRFCHWDSTIALTSKHLPNIPQELGDCVAASAEMALEYLNATEVVLLGELDSYRPIYRPWLYGIGRVYEGKNQLGRGDGSITSWQIAGMKKYGCLYEDIPGLPAYSTQVGRDWGYSKSILDKWAPQAKDYIIEYSIPIGNFEELAKAVIIGKMSVVIASNQGFQMSLKKDTTNKKSWFIPSGTWSHQMHIPAVDYSAVPSLYVGNQWDESAHSGQLDGPDGGGWTDPEFFDRWAKRATVVAFARFRASKMKKPILKMR